MKKLLTLFLLLGSGVSAQPWTQASAGLTDKFFGAELQVGYRYKQAALSVGYTSIQFVSDQPVLFNVRAGAVVDRFFFYGGYVRSVRSTDNKSLNRHTWQVGAQYHFCFYDRGNFYITGNYTQPAIISAGVGMTYNLFR